MWRGHVRRCSTLACVCLGVCRKGQAQSYPNRIQYQRRVRVCPRRVEIHLRNVLASSGISWYTGLMFHGLCPVAVACQDTRNGAILLVGVIRLQRLSVLRFRRCVLPLSS
jgi:hypothetical protein